MGIAEREPNGFRIRFTVKQPITTLYSVLALIWLATYDIY